ncbi:MAG: MBL fold metallo-hydrolase, partial [Anaerolineales bacterium]
MSIKLTKIEVGPWPMNSYVVTCSDTQVSAIVDPGDDADKILQICTGTKVSVILLTHGHYDHVQALDEVKKRSGAKVYLHPLEAKKFNIEFDLPLADGDIISIGNQSLHAIHTPGHTPGMTCFHLGDRKILVGDTIFVNGPGKTWSPEEFNTTIRTMKEVVFQWSDDTEFF